MRSFLPLVLVGSLSSLLLLSACGQAGKSGDDVPTPVLTQIVFPTATALESPTVFPPTATVASISPMPSPSSGSGRITMTLEGPGEAAPGETVQYRLRYEVIPSQGVDIVLTWSDGSLQYLSSRPTAGSGQLEEEEKSGGFAHVRWNLAGGSGELDLDLRIPEGHSAGEFTVDAYEPGTGTSQSNIVRTAIIP